MVPLEQRSTFWTSIEDNQKLLVFRNVIYQQNYLFQYDPLQLPEIDKVYFECARAIINGNKDDFRANYEIVCRRNPDSGSSLPPFVNDDILIYTLIVGVSIFDLNKDWLSRIVFLRSNSDISNTFKNILQGHFANIDNLPELILPFLNITRPLDISNQLVNDAYNAVANKSEIFNGGNNFKIILMLRSYDLAIHFKTYSIEDLVFISYRPMFLKRIRILARCISNFLLLIILGGLTLMVRKNEHIEKIAGSIALIAGIMGITVVNFIPKIKNSILRFVLKIMGYPKSIYPSLAPREND